MAHKLPLPGNLTQDDTFSQDLLRQFDKRRSRLHFELGFTSQVKERKKNIFFF